MSILKTLFGTTKKTPEEVLEQPSVFVPKPIPPVPPAPEWAEMYQASREEAAEVAFKKHITKKLKLDLFIATKGQEAYDQGMQALEYCRDNLRHVVRSNVDAGRITLRPLKKEEKQSLPDWVESEYSLIKHLRTLFPEAFMTLESIRGFGSVDRSIQVHISVSDEDMSVALTEYLYTLVKPD